MGSFKGDGRAQGRPGRRAGSAGRRRLVALDFERLEGRTLLAVGDLTPTFRPVNGDLADVKNGPLAVAGQDLVGIYQEYQAFLRGGGTGAFVSGRAGQIRVQGSLVGVDISATGDLDGFVNQLRNLGMQVEASDPGLKIVEGLLPIAQLPTVAALAQTVGISPLYREQLRQRGVANNQGDQVLRADVARTQFNVDGTGVTVGVLSDSVNQFQGGLADSVRTGDLPANVAVLMDLGAGGGSDEGRAMLEQIHDIAPGANLAFHTAFGGSLIFANGIRALARQAGARVIVDDVGRADEPFFQDGIIAQAVTDVVRNNGVSYFSSAG
ncbi:MAG TPA: hypothetical protein VF590_26915, partial [Isosphaeraceae bacterium]